MRFKSTEGAFTMNRSIRSKLIATGAVLLGALGLAQAAQAHTDVRFSIGFPAYVAPAPVYVQPEPVYVAPRPVYVQPSPVYVDPAPVYVTPGYWREREWRREEWRREEWRRWHRWNERHGDWD